MLPRLCTLLYFLLLGGTALFATDANYFSHTLYPIFSKAGCPACHNPDGVASGTRLHFPEPDASPSSIEAFGRSLGVLGELLLNKPTKRVPHAGGQRIQPGSPEEAALKTWIAYLVTLPAADAPSAKPQPSAIAPAPVLRQLTHAQYNNTVRDLLPYPVGSRRCI